MTAARRAGLYRLYDAEDRLLYIGIGYSPQARWTVHSKEKNWWPLVARKSVEWYPSWREAKAAETIAITNERPAYNIVSSPDLVLVGSTRVKYMPEVPPQVLAKVAAEKRAAEIAQAAAMERVKGASRAYLGPTHEATRTELHAAIAEALRAGVGPAALARATPYDRNYIGRIRVAAGIPARRPATVQPIERDKSTPKKSTRKEER